MTINAFEDLVNAESSRRNTPLIFDYLVANVAGLTKAEIMTRFSRMALDLVGVDGDVLPVVQGLDQPTTKSST